MAGLSVCCNKFKGIQNAGHFLASWLTTNFTKKAPTYGSFLRVSVSFEIVSTRNERPCALCYRRCTCTPCCLSWK